MNALSVNCETNEAICLPLRRGNNPRRPACGGMLPDICVRESEGPKNLARKIRGKPLAHLGHLGHSDGQAVTLTGVLGKEILVVILGIIKLTERFYRGDDSPAPRYFGTSARLLEHLSLGIVDKVHRAAILRAHIVTLTVELARIVHGEKRVKNHVGRDYCLVKLNANDLRMTGLTTTHLLVRGVIHLPTAVARNNIRNTGKHSIRGVEAPKAPTTKDKRHHDEPKSTRIQCHNVVMDALNTFTSWLTDSANLGIVVAVGVIIGSIVIAIVVGATLSSIARRRRKDAIENELNSLAPAVMNVGIDASLYANLSPEGKQLADRAAVGIDMRVRLLNRDGAAEAADWLSGRFTALRNASSLERGDTGRILDQIREAFLTWAYEPKDGIRAFRRDDLEHQRNR